MKQNLNTVNALNGFTIIEMLATLLIIGILSSFSMGYYGDYVRSSYRAEAKSALMQLANALERCRVENNAYDHVNCENIDVSSIAEDYNISVTKDATSYSLTAAPAEGSVMVGDGDFTLAHTGAKTYKGVSGWND